MPLADVRLGHDFLAFQWADTGDCPRDIASSKTCTRSFRIDIRMNEYDCNDTPKSLIYKAPIN